MKRSFYLILFILGLVVSSVAASLQSVPGYMDAAYYYANGKQLASGKGFYEPFIWNYLDNPSGLPHPSHTYWMPLASIIAAAGMVLTGSQDYFLARLFFILLAALIPPLTANLAFSLTRKVPVALTAGGFALFPGFYLIYLTVSETFILYFLLGTLFIMTAFATQGKLIRPLPNPIRFLLLGILAGLMHLTRADGIIWLAAALGVGGWHILRYFNQNRQIKAGWKQLLKMSLIVLPGILVGYGLVMSPWYWRNYQEYHTLMPPGGSQTLWLTDYNQTFIYPSTLLNFKTWSSAGWVFHLQARLSALSSNLKTVVGVSGEVFLLPLMLVGMWQLRRDGRVIFTLLMWFCTLGVMTVVFPYSGARGGFFHSTSALQPILWAVAAEGLDTLLLFGVRFRHWKLQEARLFLGSGFVLISLMLSIVLFKQRVFGNDMNQPVWQDISKRYTAVESFLQKKGFQQNDVVLVNDPPDYYVATGRPALVIPDGNEVTLLEVAHKYGAKVLVLEKTLPVGLQQLYLNPDSVPGLKYIDSLDGTQIYQVDTTP